MSRLEKIRPVLALTAAMTLAAGSAAIWSCAFLCASSARPTAPKAVVALVHACHQATPGTESVSSNHGCAAHPQEFSAAPAVPEVVVKASSAVIASHAITFTTDSATSTLVWDRECAGSSPPHPRPPVPLRI